ncbi:MAG TPA: FAD-dependent oxidoreductase [Thermoanaerobaculia bacterium]|nr:FAD-dependent oxidoreductase [Thermoanaerobaculia bacterium]
MVVGAGIVGTLAAAQAARRRPDWRVLLVDRGLAGGGATRHSAALCIPFGRTEGHRRMERESDRFYRALRAERPDLPIRGLRCLVVAREGSLEELRTRCTTGLREAPAGSFPGLSLAPDERLLEADGASYALPDPVIAALRPAGVWEGVEITAVRSREEGLELATADGRAIAARRVLLAPGPWALEGPAGGLARGAEVRVKKVVALHLDVVPGPDDPVLYFFDADAFLLPLVERRHWLLSFTCQEWDVSPDAPLRITEEDRRQGLAVLSRYCPAWAERCVGGRVFCDAYGPEWVPVVAAAPDEPRIVLATAGSGGGYRLGPAIARQGLDAVISGVSS